MFTGIITHRGKVAKKTAKQKGLTLSLRVPKNFTAKLGESVSVNGVCSTVAAKSSHALIFQYMAETLAKTNVSTLLEGNRVNLEKSMTLQSLVSGHLVQGHIDETGIVKQITHEGTSHTFFISASTQNLSYVAPKGSITIEGVSLTVVKKLRDGFTVSLIPYTLSHTTLGTKKIGDLVNIEYDMIAKYLKELTTHYQKHHARKRK